MTNINIILAQLKTCFLLWHFLTDKMTQWDIKVILNCLVNKHFFFKTIHLCMRFCSITALDLSVICYHCILGVYFFSSRNSPTNLICGVSVFYYGRSTRLAESLTLEL